MNSLFTLDNLLVALCAISFLTTGVCLVLTVMSRISFMTKTRLLRVFFSFGLTAVVAGLLALAGETVATGSPLAAKPASTFAVAAQSVSR